MPEQAFISLGSNVQPEKFLPLAVGRLHELGRVTAVSKVYQSPAVGPADQPDFLNAAAIVVTSLTWAQTRERLRRIEVVMGRVRESDKFSARQIDLDLCLYGDLVVRTDQVVIPPPETVEQAYVAVPLAELAPSFRHPVTGEMLEAVAGRLRVRSRLKRRDDVVLHVESPPQG